MNISELIDNLQEIKDKYGDMIVYMHADKTLEGDFIYAVNDFNPMKYLNLLVLKFNKQKQNELHERLMAMTDEQLREFYADK